MIHQIAEGMFHMQTLFQYAQAKPHLSPSEALRQICLQFESTPPSSLLNQGFPQQAQHALNPNLHLHSGVNPPHFLSPAHAAHLNLPVNSTGTSPATLNMSPAMQNLGLHNNLTNTPQMQQMQQMQQPPTSVGMVAQPSQQGTNTSGGTGSQVTSANASPNVQTKRRRPSTMLKAEGDDGGGQVGVNGASLPDKVKASPKVGVKRQKGNG
jgi:hypothetical protein